MDIALKDVGESVSVTMDVAVVCCRDQLEEQLCQHLSQETVKSSRLTQLEQMLEKEGGERKQLQQQVKMTVCLFDVVVCKQSTHACSNESHYTVKCNVETI